MTAHNCVPDNNRIECLQSYSGHSLNFETKRQHSFINGSGHNWSRNLCNSFIIRCKNVLGISLCYDWPRSEAARYHELHIDCALFGRVSLPLLKIVTCCIGYLHTVLDTSSSPMDNLRYIQYILDSVSKCPHSSFVFFLSVILTFLAALSGIFVDVRLVWYCCGNMLHPSVCFASAFADCCILYNELYWYHWKSRCCESDAGAILVCFDMQIGFSNAFPGSRKSHCSRWEIYFNGVDFKKSVVELRLHVKKTQNPQKMSTQRRIGTL